MRTVRVIAVLCCCTLLCMCWLAPPGCAVTDELADVYSYPDVIYGDNIVWVHYRDNIYLAFDDRRESLDGWSAQYDYYDVYLWLDGDLVNAGTLEQYAGQYRYDEAVLLVVDGYAKQTVMSWRDIDDDTGVPMQLVVRSLTDEQLLEWWANPDTASVVGVSYVAYDPVDYSQLWSVPAHLSHANGQIWDMSTEAGVRAMWSEVYGLLTSGQYEPRTVYSSGVEGQLTITAYADGIDRVSDSIGRLDDISGQLSELTPTYPDISGQLSDGIGVITDTSKLDASYVRQLATLAVDMPNTWCWAILSAMVICSYLLWGRKD